MPLRLTLIAHAGTAALRAARFPLDEPIDAHERTSMTEIEPERRAGSCRCGPELRTRQTAAMLGYEPVVDAALRDADHGSWAGSTLAEVEADDPVGIAAWLSDPSSAPHGGESIAEVLARSRAWLEHLTGTPDDGIERVVAVTHPAIVRALVVAAIEATAGSFWRIDVPPLSTTVLQGGSARWSLRELVRPGAS